MFYDNMELYQYQCYYLFSQIVYYIIWYLVMLCKILTCHLTNCNLQLAVEFYICHIGITCGHPSVPINGRVNYDTVPDNSGRLPYGTLATYSCSSKYILIGNAMQRCTGNGSNNIGLFDGAPPYCQGKCS